MRAVNVGGNPETLTDPTGEFFAQGDDNGMVQNIGRLSNTTTADGGSGISVVTENINTGRTTRTVVPIKKPVQPVVSGGNKCGGCKMATRSSSSNKTQDGCDTKCQAQEHARSIARGAAENFQAVANWLNAAGAFFALISAALLAGSVWAPWLVPWGIATLGFSAALFLIAGKASEVSRLFNEEAGNSLSWFTKANLDGMRNQMFGSLLGLSSFTILGGFGFTKIGEIVEKAIMQGPELVKDITPALSFHVGAFTFLVTDVVGTGVMAGFVQYVTSQQEEGLT